MQDSATTDQTGGFTLNLQLTAIDRNVSMAEDFYLGDSYPNPFNPVTNFKVTTKAQASLSIYNIQGQLVDRLHLPAAGNYVLSWGGSDLQGRPVSAGVYIYRLKAPNRSIARKMTLLDGG